MRTRAHGIINICKVHGLIDIYEKGNWWGQKRISKNIFGRVIYKSKVWRVVKCTISYIEVTSHNIPFATLISALQMIVSASPNRGYLL